MSLSDDSAPKNATSGRLSILSRIALVLARFRASFSEQQVGKGKGGHLGQRRAIRLSALLAPRNRRRVGAGAGVLIIVGAVAAALALRSPESLPLNNAIWLDQAWTYGDLEDSQIRDFTDRLAEHQIGKAYVYASSLSIDNRWSGAPQGNLSFMESRSEVADFVTAFKSKHSDMRVFAWIEIWAHLDNVDSYRLDDSDLHSNIADFCQLLVTQLGFDGLLLDVKPLFSDNSDLIRLIQQVRAAVGRDVPLAVAVTADLTPQDRRLQNLESIAPGTMWSASFKRRLLVSVDEVVLLMYQSYRQKPLDYINWVAYHVETYIEESDSSTGVLVSIPNYGGASSAHNPTIETMANALDGVREGLRRLDEEQHKQLTGIAIYSDDPLSQSEWNTFRDMWLQR
ncbi:MAG: hypothetical protein OXN88_05550 [Chloroflexota bacterium]|nr:hypothetical protein [Chloroflexota bacterium]